MTIKTQNRWTRLRPVGMLLGILALAPACQGEKASSESKKPEKAIVEISGVEQLQSVLDSSKDRLLVFDMYADWCMPCRILGPLLEKVAGEQADKADFYKVNVDKNPEIAAAFGVRGIPFVVFVRNRIGLEALTGVQPAATYVRTINRLVQETADVNADTPNGEIVDGVRVIRLNTEMAPGNLYVYRGETVKLIIERVSFPYSIHIPAYDVAQEADQGSDLVVTFKAEDIGVFPVFCNGNCPVGDGSRFGQIVVMQYEAEGDASFKELTAKQAKAFVGSRKPLVLDVRTPKEYYAGHIPGAALIPLSQLQDRFNEIDEYKDRPVLLYCRSGNRSTVAAQILVRNGFKDLYHLRPGLKGWASEGYKVSSTQTQELVAE
ncbi:MAG: hypothetical protein GF331_17280 [Chitinivibrionales bacterium]|nr:hypothetical protein [Chitinivibrionales bacterium]